MTTPVSTNMWRSAAVLAAYILVTFMAPALAAFFMPGEWYAALRKPAWNPPAWLFGPVWTVLYILMAVAAWLVWRCGGWAGQRRALTLYGVQLALNAVWSPLFFGLKMPGVAFVEMLLLLATVAVTARAFGKARAAAAWLLLPYLGWLCFAAVLNFTLWRLNS